MQPTSPLRLVEDIDGCIKLCLRKNANTCVSIAKSDKSPYWMYFLDSEGRLQPFDAANSRIPLRQNLPSVYVPNGAVYAAKVKWFIENQAFITVETVGYVMLRERSLDIDTEHDMKIASYFLGMRESKDEIL